MAKEIFNFSIDELAAKVAAVVSLNTKEVLTSDEVARYIGMSRSYVYKLTMRHEIPHYKPNGKMCYFNRKEVEEWLQQNRVATADELEARAQTYCAKKKGGAL